VVDLTLPGITVRAIRDLTGDSHFSEVFFDDVLLPEDALIGTDGAGWEQVNAELAFERSGPERLYSSAVLLEEWLRHLRRQPQCDTAQLTLLGRFASHLAVLREMSIGITARLAAGESPVASAALVKDLGTEFEQALPALIADALGSGETPPDAALQKTLTYLTLIAPAFSLRGGTREILRGMIARALGLR
jgi:alkylation response protein AidB-like acyl-CoA dehydrogenase